MKARALGMIVLTSLVGTHAPAETAPPRHSWVVVRVAGSSAQKKRNHVRGRIVFPPGPRTEATIWICRAARTPDPRGVMLEEFGCQEHKTTADGRFDIKVPEPSDKEALLISAASRDYFPADVLLESGGVEIDFILVAKASEATR